MNIEKPTVAIIVLNNFTNDSRVLKEAKTLQENNYNITVVALHEEPLKEFDIVKNIPVHRIKLKSRNWSKNKIVQLFKYFELIYKIVKKYKNSDIVHCNDLNTLPIAVIIKKGFNEKLKIIYDAHEYETETNGLSGISKKLYKRLEKYLIKYADHVITVSDSIADEYVRLYQIKKPSLILNTPPLREKVDKKDLFRKKFNIAKKQKIFLYQGKLAKGRGIDILLQTFSQTSMKNNCIIFMGYGHLEDKIKSMADKVAQIYFHEAVPHGVILDYTSSADCGISFIEDSCLSYRYCLPNKLFEYMMAEVPVVCSNLPEMKKVVENYKLGVVANEITQQGVSDAIDQIVEFQKPDDLSKIKDIFCWESQEKELLKIYNNLESHTNPL